MADAQPAPRYKAVARRNRERLVYSCATFREALRVAQTLAREHLVVAQVLKYVTRGTYRIVEVIVPYTEAQRLRAEQRQLQARLARIDQLLAQLPQGGFLGF